MYPRKTISTEELNDLAKVATKLRFSYRLEIERVEHFVALDGQHFLQPLFLHEAAVEPSEADRIRDGFALRAILG